MPSLKQTSMIRTQKNKYLEREQVLKKKIQLKREREENLRKIEETFLHIWGNAWL